MITEGQYLDALYLVRNYMKQVTKEMNSAKVEVGLSSNPIFNKKMVDISSSVRLLNCLKCNNIDTIGDLVRIERSEFFKFRNFGMRSMRELEQILEDNGLEFNMFR